jgi:hypothetical protein
MEKPIMKNHFITDQINDLKRLIEVLHTHETIYVRSWHRVQSTSFFHHRNLYPIERLIKMVDAGEFWCCEKKKHVQQNRIRFQLLSMQENTKALSNKAMAVSDISAAIDEFDDAGLTIAEITERIQNKKTDQ